MILDCIYGVWMEMNRKVIKTDRGGDITCHGPGQLVGYPIIDLKRYNKSITWFMRGLETSIISIPDLITFAIAFKNTNLSILKENDQVNIEFDPLARYINEKYGK